MCICIWLRACVRSPSCVCTCLRGALLLAHVCACVCACVRVCMFGADYRVISRKAIVATHHDNDLMGHYWCIETSWVHRFLQIPDPFPGNAEPIQNKNCRRKRCGNKGTMTSRQTGQDMTRQDNTNQNGTNQNDKETNAQRTDRATGKQKDKHTKKRHRI